MMKIKLVVAAANAEPKKKQIKPCAGWAVATNQPLE
jgi:hypothetical protein